MLKRQAILVWFLGRLATIQIANGFSTDAGLKILFGASAELSAEDPETAAVKIVVGDDLLEDCGDDVLTRLPIDVQAIAKVDSDQPGMTIEAVIGDIAKAIEVTDRTLGGLLTRDLLRGRTRALSRDPGATSIGAARQYTAIYVEAWGG